MNARDEYHVELIWLIKELTRSNIFRKIGETKHIT